MNSNYYQDVYNCVKDKPCPSGYECCSEKTSPNIKKTYGLCCREGTCNGRGHCSAPEHEFNEPNIVKESFAIFQREGYNDKEYNCNSWKIALLVMSILAVMLFVCIVVISFSSKMKS